MINLPGTYTNTKSDKIEICVKCKSPIERGTMFIEHKIDDKKEIICHFCYYKMKKNNLL
ncbi:MAG: hypothetical protein ACTSPY_17360 [Candidatus Helarchaeota archaeon]